MKFGWQRLHAEYANSSASSPPVGPHLRAEHAPPQRNGHGLPPRSSACRWVFTAYAELRLPQVAAAFTHLGFPAYFRVELSWAKLLGVVLLLTPVPARLKEWAYAGFAIDLGSALIAHLAVGDGPAAWGGGHRRALGPLVLLLAPPASHAGERLIAR